MSEFDELQKLAIPSAAENTAGDDPFREGRKLVNKKKPRKVNKVSAKDAEKALGKEPEPEPAEEPEQPVFAHLDEPVLPPQGSYRIVEKVVKEIPEDCRKYKEFIGQAGRATIELNDGTFTVPVITVRESKYGVMVVTSTSSDTMVFVPKPGTQLTLSFKDKSWEVFCPGAYIEFDELGIGVLALIKAE